MKGILVKAQLLLFVVSLYYLFSEHAHLRLFPSVLNGQTGVIREATVPSDDRDAEVGSKATQQPIQTAPVDSRRPKGRIPFDFLTDLRTQNETQCPPGLHLALSNPKSRFDQSKYKIPMVVHQTYKGRCLDEGFYELHQRWKTLGFAYYFHTDESMEKLVLSGNFPEFPHLPLIWKHCITKPVVKTDFWRLLLLWEYGGVYADLDTSPKKFFQPKEQIKSDMEMLTFTDSEGFPSFHFMAAVPKHPLIFLILQEGIKSILYHIDTGAYNPAIVTGKLVAPLIEAGSVCTHHVVNSHLLVPRPWSNVSRHVFVPSRS